MVLIRDIQRFAGVHRREERTSAHEVRGFQPRPASEYVSTEKLLEALRFLPDIDVRSRFFWKGGEVIIHPDPKIADKVKTESQRTLKERQRHNYRTLSSMRHLKDVRELRLGESTPVVAWLNPNDGKLSAVYDQVGIFFEGSISLFLEITRNEAGFVISDIHLDELRRTAPQYEEEWIGYLNMRLPQTSELPAITRPEIEIQREHNDAMLISLHNNLQVIDKDEGSVFLMHALVDKPRGLIQALDFPGEFLEESPLSLAELKVTKGDHDLRARWTNLTALDGMSAAFRVWFERGDLRITKPNGVPGRVEVVHENSMALPPIPFNPQNAAHTGYLTTNTNGMGAFGQGGHVFNQMITSVLPSLRFASFRKG